MLNIHVVQRIFGIFFCFYGKNFQVSTPKLKLSNDEKFCPYFNNYILSGIINQSFVLKYSTSLKNT